MVQGTPASAAASPKGITLVPCSPGSAVSSARLLYPCELSDRRDQTLIVLCDRAIALAFRDIGACGRGVFRLRLAFVAQGNFRYPPVQEPLLRLA